MVILTYKDLDAIAGALALVQDEEQQLEPEPYERAFKKIIAAMNEAEGIEPKPQFKLTHEEE